MTPWNLRKLPEDGNARTSTYKARLVPNRTLTIREMRKVRERGDIFEINI